jgi:nitrite reductase/ring-hydroxylating ferredoxin subunit
MPKFIKATTTDKIPKGKMKKVDVLGNEIMLANVNGKIYAIDNICSHEGCTLHKGELKDYTVVCPCHGAKFDVRNGDAQKETPWGSGQDSFKVKTEGKNVLVEV